MMPSTNFEKEKTTRSTNEFEHPKTPPSFNNLPKLSQQNSKAQLLQTNMTTSANKTENNYKILVSKDQQSQQTLEQQD